MSYLRAVPLLLLVCAWPAAAADKAPPPDPAFLEYLGSFGNDEEDWTLFADDEEDEPATAPPPAKEPAKPDGSKSEAADKPAAEKR